MKFIADVMLGKLAKWLRIMGIDVIYNPTMSDQKLISLALKEKRIILTRDAKLLEVLKNKSFENYLFISSNYLWEQLAQVIDHYHIDPLERAFTRCILCNQRLVKKKKEEIEDLVAPYVYSTQKEFSQCPQCYRVYWPGTHKDDMISKLNTLKKL